MTIPMERPGRTIERKELERLRVINARMTAFVEWCIKEGPWQGNSLDGWDVQDRAVEFGILKRVTYDPAKHGPNDIDVAPGDTWYVFTDEFRAARGVP